MIKSVDVNKLIKECALEIKKIKEIKPPEWSRYAKTEPHKKYPPKNSEWWYIRSESILRKIYLDGPIGVSRLRAFYGGKKERGHKPEHFVKAGGSHIRKILLQLETAALIEKNKNGRAGRVLTNKGRTMINKISMKVR